MKSWNEWRAQYDQLSYKEQKQFYNEAEEIYPIQIHYSGLVAQYLIHLDSPIKIMEIGGWKGNLAASVLYQNSHILQWDNYEICENCIGKKECFDPRYRIIVPADFVWKINLPSYDLIVSTHTFEHLKAIEIEEIIKRHRAKVYLIEVPHGGNWHNYNGSHILPLNSDQLNALFVAQGYILKWQDKDVRYFELQGGIE